MPATAVRVVAVPSRQEIEERFRDLYPELLSRACTIAARERDPEEVVQELLSFAWWNFSSSARRGKWLTPSQMGWVGMRRVRGEGCTLGSPRSRTDVLSPGCQRRRRANVISLSAFDEGLRPGRLQHRFDEVIIEGQRNPADEAAVRIDWQALRTALPGRLRRVLDGLAIGRGTSEIAKRLRLSPARVSQIKADLASAVAGFFGDALPGWTRA